MERLLDDARGMNDLGFHFGDDLYAREIDYLQAKEWAMTAEDILWRRSKRGLHVAPATVTALKAWLGGQAAADSRARAP
jgi:glycerol-3-phosphate dehydrogenase